jgi:predicted O-linked N-acetylglucosamine transferase (SPINDLY family)
MAEMNPQQILSDAMQRHQAGDLPAAEALYQQFLALQPEHSWALHLLGTLALETGRPRMAADLIRKALVRMPSWAEAYGNLGLALQRDGNRNQAISAFKTAIALKPDYFDAHNNLGATLFEEGKFADAIAEYGMALRINPDSADAHNNLGNALRADGKTAEAITAYRRAIEIDPALAAVHHNLGMALNAMESHDESLASIETALRLDPRFAQARCSLGETLMSLGRVDEAVAAFDAAIQISPDDADILSNLIFALNYDPRSTSTSLLTAQRAWSDRHARPLQKFIQPHRNDRSPRRRLRIGYVSGDFRKHIIGFCVWPLLRHHDRANFEVFLYSNARHPDAITDRIRSCAHQWRNIAFLGDEAAAQVIRDDGIDILVDLAMHTKFNRLLIFAHKPAPIQTTLLAYPGGTAMDSMDYRISDPYLDPPGQSEQEYVEKTARVAHTFWCFDPEIRSVQLEPRPGPLPALSSGYPTFGSLNNFCKVNEPLIELWAKVMRSATSSRMILRAPAPSARAKVVEKFQSQGIDPSRLELVPGLQRPAYLDLYRRIDIALDCTPYNGHTTSLDAFWMGVPVVTRVGSTVVGRAGYSQLCNLGLPELAADSDEQFVEIASRLAQDLPRLAELRAGLRARMQGSPLMDAEGYAQDIEAVYRQLWQQWCAG